MKRYILIYDQAKFAHIYADSRDGARVRCVAGNQVGTFVFYKHNGCLRGRSSVFHIAAYRVISLTEHEVFPGEERAYGGYL